MMSPRDYEAYVAAVVRGLSICRGARVYTNRRYSGVRQPGSYEIDVSCEIIIDEALWFLVIVECKNWQRPVDREEVQKLIQTRDAISAHKAAFASPVGYSREAVEVAKTHRVALWVVAKGDFRVIAGGGAAAVAVADWMSSDLGALVRSLIGYAGRYYANLHSGWVKSWYGTNLKPVRAGSLPSDGNLVPVDWVAPSWNPWSEPYPTYATSAFDVGGGDPILALVSRHILDHLDSGGAVAQQVEERLATHRSALKRGGLSPDLVDVFLKEVLRLVAEGGGFPFGSWDAAAAFDRQIDHSAVALLAPEEWLAANGRRSFVYTAVEADSPVSVANNVVWANVTWLLDRYGLLLAH